MDKLLKKVLKKIKPSERDKKLVKQVTEEIIQRINKTCAKKKIDARPLLVGSAARGTRLRTERNIDIFLIFSKDLSREELVHRGLAIAREVAGTKGEERFAEHPYVRMKYKGFEIDLVPCYNIPDPTKIKSAVDRTPHHQKYLEKKLTPELVDEVLLTKRFMSGIGVYGAELKVQGFSGYLCELLTVHYGSFRKLVEAASRWTPGIIIDPERLYRDESEPKMLFERKPLTVIDPTDPNRNVAAAVSTQNFAIFVRACQDFLSNPRMEFFFPRKTKMLGIQTLKKIIQRRGTRIFCVMFSHTDMVPDVLYPKLRKIERKLVSKVTEAGFEVLRSDVWGNSDSGILLEFRVSRLPRVKKRLGPPLTLDVGNFVKKHLKTRKRLAGPYIDSTGRMVFEMEYDETDASKALKRIMEDRDPTGNYVVERIGKSYQIIPEGGFPRLLKNKNFRKFISEYFTRCLPWYR